FNRSADGYAKVSRILAAGGRDKRAMDGARPTQDRMSTGCSRGTAAPVRCPARCTGPGEPRSGVPAEGKAAPADRPRRPAGARTVDLAVHFSDGRRTFFVGD